MHISWEGNKLSRLGAAVTYLKEQRPHTQLNLSLGQRTMKWNSPDFMNVLNIFNFETTLLGNVECTLLIWLKSGSECTIQFSYRLIIWQETCMFYVVYALGINDIFTSWCTLFMLYVWYFLRFGFSTSSCKAREGVMNAQLSDQPKFCNVYKFFKGKKWTKWKSI